MSTVLRNSNGTKRPGKTPSVQSPNKADRASVQVSHEIDTLVTQLRRRLWLRGGCILTATAATAILTLTVLDAVLQPQTFVMRASMWIAALLLLTAALRRFLLLPLRLECSRLQLAWSLEQRHPEIEERLTSTLQLAGNGDQQTSVFVEAIAGQAQAEMANCSDDDPAARSLRRAFLYATLGTLSLVVALLVSPHRLLPSLANVMRPWHERVLPRLDADVNPGNTSVPEGTNVTITVRGQNLDDAVVEFFNQEPLPVSHSMVPDANSQKAEFLLTNLKTPVTYRIHSHGFYSEKFQINVHPAPVIQQVTASAQYPEYTQLTTLQLDHLEGQNPVGRIPAVHGTLVKISAKTLAKITESELTFDSKTTTGNRLETPAGEEGATVEWTIPVASLAPSPATSPATSPTPDIRRGSVVLISDHGVRSEPVEFEILVMKDLPPRVEIPMAGPGQLTVKPDQQLTLPYRAADDYGIGSLELITKQGTQEPTTSAIPLPDISKQQNGETILNLATLNLKPGDVVTVWFRATDNRGAGVAPDDASSRPQSTDSKPLCLQVANDALPPGQQTVQAERDLVQNVISEAIDKLTKALERAEQYSDAIKPETKSDDEDPAVAPEKNADKPEASPDLQAQKEQPLPAQQEQALKSSTEIREQIQAAQKALEKIEQHAKAQPEPLFQPETQQLADVSERELREADQQASLIPLSDKTDDRRKAVESTKQELETALKKLNDIRESVDQRSREMELAAKLDELAKQQDQLAKELNDAKNNPEGNAQKQQNVAEALQKIANEDEQTRSELFRQRSDLADRLAKEAEQLKQQQEQLAQLSKEQAAAQKTADVDQKLMEMIAREQEAVRQQTQTTESDKNATAKPQKEQNADQLKAAQQHMDEAAKQLREKSPDRAQEQAQKAMEELSKTDPDKQSLAQQQQRVRDAIEAVRENRPEDAAAKLQEQIAERTEQLRKKADDLLQLPSDDAQNQQAMKDAQEKLQQASEEAKAAKDAMNEANRPDAEKQDQKNKQPAQQQPAQQQPAQQQPAQQQPAQQQQAQQQQAQQQPAQQQPAQQQQAQQQQAQQQPQAKPEQKAADKQSRAAKALDEAMQSLQGVCKSCQNCANCKKPGGSSGSSGKPGTSSSNSNSGQKSQPAANGNNATPKPGENPDPKQEGDKQLAQAADKASQTAKAPSPKAASELARDLNQLADKAAKSSQFPGRKNNSDKSSKPSEKPGEKLGSQPSDSKQSPKGKSGGKSGQPEGATGEGQSSDEIDSAEQLRGPSSSNWTRSRRMLNGNVLDANEARIPQEYRDVVEDYFEQLSRLESRDDETQKETPKNETEDER